MTTESNLAELAQRKSREWPWRPIETAPKDGQHILVIDTTPGATGFGWFSGTRVAMQAIVHWWNNPGEEGWYPSVGADPNCPALTRITHWMPLPRPPSCATEGQE